MGVNVSEWWEYGNLESRYPYDWGQAYKIHDDDDIDFHIDLGAGKLPKARLSIDSRGEPNVKMDLDTLKLYRFGKETPPFYHPSMYYDPETVKNNKFNKRALPFPDNSIESIVSHHCLEHIGTGFVRLMDECYRVLKPGGKFRIVVPLFPSFAAVDDVDHTRYFTPDSFQCFVHDAGSEIPFWTESFSTPYTNARFKLTNKWYTPAPEFDLYSGPISIDRLFEGSRELRVTLEK